MTGRGWSRRWWACRACAPRSKATGTSAAWSSCPRSRCRCRRRRRCRTTTTKRSEGAGGVDQHPPSQTGLSERSRGPALGLQSRSVPRTLDFERAVRRSAHGQAHGERRVDQHPPSQTGQSERSRGPALSFQRRSLPRTLDSARAERRSAPGQARGEWRLLLHAVNSSPPASLGEVDGEPRRDARLKAAWSSTPLGQSGGEPLLLLSPLGQNAAEVPPRGGRDA